LPPTVLLTAACLLAASAGLAGCGKSFSTVGVQSGTTTWSIAAKEPIAGLHEGSIEFTTLQFGPPGGVSVALWSDSSSSASRASSSTAGAFMDGEFPAASGTPVAYHCETKNGVHVLITVDGTEFDSRQGALILVASRGKEPRVAQLNVNVTDIPKTAEQILDFARQHPEIEKFFRDANATPPVEEQP
jgi:hypothetical protein